MSEYKVKAQISYEEQDRSGMHHYAAYVWLPSKVRYSDLEDVIDQMIVQLKAHRPDMQVYGEVSLESDRVYDGMRLLVTLEGITPHAPCTHLADSGWPMEGTSTEPCKLCGRYYVDD